MGQKFEEKIVNRSEKPILSPTFWPRLSGLLSYRAIAEDWPIAMRPTAIMLGATGHSREASPFPNLEDR